MIPYFPQPSIDLGPVTIHAFGVIVTAAVLIGLEVARRRLRHLGLDMTLSDRLAGWTLIGGFLGAHLFAVLLYVPEKVAADPFVLLKVWEHLSSFGGILGGLLGLWIFVRVRVGLDRANCGRYLDAVAYAFPVALLVGRFACTVAHDHPGSLTRMPLAVSLAAEPARVFIRGVYAAAGRVTELPADPELARVGFHDLGWYEFLYLGLVVVPITLWLGRRSRPAGTFVVSFVLLYMPVRFALDFLRVSDVRYAGLTPAQWVALIAVLLLAASVVWRRTRVARAGTPNESFHE
ncbi:MAG: prolipoprotein diacylglyceryl transferase [Gemmatimonadales bacterium]|nr:prolipoprotein diacylglyceryl transferase [Gemmatimonadales bacterium]